MNPRIQWSRSLPPSHPPMVEEARKLLHQCGINLSVDDITFITQIVFGYLSKRSDGHRILYKLLRDTFKAEPASYLKTYYKEGYFGMEEGHLDYKKLELLQVWLYDNKNVVPHGMIEIMDRPNHAACDDCGVLVPMGYCSANVTEWSGGKEHVRTYCNRCRLYNTDPKIRDTSKRATCEDCKLQTCAYWNEFHRAKEVPNEPTKSLTSTTTTRPPNPFVSPTLSRLEQATNPKERYSSL